MFMLNNGTRRGSADPVGQATERELPLWFMADATMASHNLYTTWPASNN